MRLLLVGLELACRARKGTDSQPARIPLRDPKRANRLQVPWPQAALWRKGSGCPLTWNLVTIWCLFLYSIAVFAQRSAEAAISTRSAWARDSFTKLVANLSFDPAPGLDTEEPSCKEKVLQPGAVLHPRAPRRAHAGPSFATLEAFGSLVGDRSLELKSHGRDGQSASLYIHQSFAVLVASGAQCATPALSYAESPCGFGQDELDREIAEVFNFSETEATEDAGQEAPQAVGHAAGHLGRLTLRLPRDDTDVSWTSPLFSESGSQCPAGLQSRNT
ncbi:unnamed protein product [Symbiodinium microadriaticum]|nr:unnamed protein product [Symbiodinium microadriaticum]